MNRDLILILVFLGLWFALNKWILPWLGIPTCMSGGCCGTSYCEIQASPSTDQNEPRSSPASEPAKTPIEVSETRTVTAPEISP